MTVRVWMARHGLYIAWVVSLMATSGSFVFSEVLHWQPCELCWFQRVFMYPQVVILGIACLRNDRRIWSYSLGMSLIGVLFSIYHYMLQHFAAIATHAPCSANGISCETDYLNWFGFITIPMLAGTAFSLIILCMVFVRLGAPDSFISQELPQQQV